MEQYEFETQLSVGARGELFLDKFFAGSFSIYPAEASNLQRLGIDRIFVGKKTGRIFSVEYKTDETAVKTGNAFIETISVDTQNKKGWAFTSCAQWIIYLVPGKKIYIISNLNLKSKVRDWMKAYREQPIPNNGYITKGLLVPLRELDPICCKVFALLEKG